MLNNVNICVANVLKKWFKYNYINYGEKNYEYKIKKFNKSNS